MKYVLITGGTSGIGFELARIFAKESYGIVIVSSNIENLEKTKNSLREEFEATVITVCQDMGRLGAAAAIYKRTKELNIPVSVLVNNAGFGLIGPSDEIDFDRDEKMMVLNMINLTELCKLYLPDMYKAGYGRILNTASTGAFQPGPYTSTYYASKSFVLSYSRAVRYEAKKRGVYVSALCPGSTKTRFFEKEGTKTPAAAMSAGAVAAAAYRGLMSGKEVIVPGFINRLARILPTKIKVAGVAGMKKRMYASASKQK